MSRLAIIGGGLVGSLLAVMMKKRGHQVTLYEKRSDPRKAQEIQGRSINLIITSRGLHALKQVGLLEGALKLTVSVTGRMIHSLEGEQTYQAYGRDPSECNYSISRAQLNHFLLDEAQKLDIPIHFEHELAQIDFGQKQATFTTPSGKQSADYEVLLGTDGAGSKAREQMKLHLPDFSETVDLLSSGYKELFMPLDEKGLPQFEKQALHIWPRGHHMLMALPNLDGSFTMTLYLPYKGAGVSFENLQKSDEIATYLKTYFADALERMPNAIQEFGKNPEGILGTVRSSTWIYQDSVALLGDAAHAIVPFFGQGMNSGLEDCTVLAKFLDQENENWGPALKHFDQWQRPQANAIADMALENFVEMSDKVGDKEFLLKKKLEAALEARFPKKYRARYGMITYTLIPYAIAQEIGRVQDQLLNHLIEQGTTADTINWEQAESLIDELITPLVKRYDLNLEKYRP